MHNFRYLTLLFSLLLAGQAYGSAALEALTDTAHRSWQGQTLSYQNVVGSKPLYIKFWATWCVPCNEQMPHFQHAFEEYGDKVEFVSINLGVNETPQAMAEMVEKYKLTMPILQDNSGELVRAFSLMGTPWHILVNREGRIVHKGHDADAQLDKRLALIAAQQPGELPAISLSAGHQQGLELQGKGTQMLYFTATWCDWYLKESRPEQSKNCVAGQQFFNKLADAHPKVNSLGIVSRLWTEQKDLDEYRDKFSVAHELAIDSSLDAAIGFGINQLPTLVIIKDGQEIYRQQDFMQSNDLASIAGLLAN
ncbi:TlpA family protein disulfide reductase [Bowmanella denitrificans]|uniref:TlpA family protein disulfide reductase n=1 Tax=Bowmanella denitrificans TaxID=366582 RepID=UPI000C9B0635|nr:redoxin family protein [Bowmanella denitrificans]